MCPHKRNNIHLWYLQYVQIYQLSIFPPTLFQCLLINIINSKDLQPLIFHYYFLASSSTIFSASNLQTMYLFHTPHHYSLL